MAEKLVHCEVHEGVATLTLDNPPVNGYSFEMFQQLDAFILEARMNESVHVLILTGAGEKFFCAGADIGMLQKADPTFKYYFCLHANETLLRLEHTPKLVIAALNGHTVGGGLEVAMACDLRVACQGKGKVGLPEVGLGVLPGTGGTQRLTRLLGRSKALQLMVEGRNLSMDEALEIGLVHQVLDASPFLPAVQEYARQFCPPGKAAYAVGHIKRSVVSGADLSLEAGLALERELQAKLFASEDARAGLQAYLAKEVPEFKGR
jgi:enoyl-CoA hydratase/carnithine racemase